MAKLIFTSRYLKDAKPSQKENYVHYIGTRKGVEKIDTSKKHLPATVSQGCSAKVYMHEPEVERYAGV